VVASPKTNLTYFLTFIVSDSPVSSKATEPVRTPEPTTPEVNEILPVQRSAEAKCKPTKPINNEESFCQALEDDALKEGLTFLLTGRDTSVGQRCKTCKHRKTDNQSWAEHNLSEDHIKGLINSRGCNTALTQLDQEYRKVLQVRCELCQSISLLYNVHRLEDEHQRRKTELYRLVQLAAEKHVIRRWNKIGKQNNISGRNVSKALQFFKKHPSRNH